MFRTKAKVPRSAPLFLTDPEPYSIEISISGNFGRPEFIDKREPYHHAWFSTPKLKSEFDENYRRFNLESHIYTWCRSNLKKPWQAYYKYPREAGYYYMALSCYTDAMLFRFKMSDWYDREN